MKHVILLLLVATLPASALVTVSGVYPASPVKIDTGVWNGFVGTAVSPNQFLTSGHVGGSIGDAFVINGMSYTATAVVSTYYLSLWTVDHNFHHWAALDFSRRDARDPAPVFMTGGNGTTGWNNARFSSFFAWSDYSSDDGTYRGHFEAQAVSGDSGGGLWTFNDRNPELSGIVHSVYQRFDVPSYLDRTFSITLAGHEQWLTSNLTPAPIPEPAAPTLLLLATGMLAIAVHKRNTR